jgi:sec-independent protein translocase protein TatC
MFSRETPDEDDFFKDTRMSFGDHIEALRTHLWRAIAGLLVCCLIGFALDLIGLAFGTMKIGVARPLFVIIEGPVKEAIAKYNAKQDKKFEEEAKNEGSEAEVLMRPIPVKLGFTREQRALLLGKPVDEIGPDDVVEITVMMPTDPIKQNIDAKERKIRPRILTSLSAQEVFMVYFKISIIAGFVIASPWVFWQIWSFIGAGLYPHEKRFVHVYLPVSVSLFLIGVIASQIWVMPSAVSAMLWFNDFLGITPDLRLKDYLGFAILLPVLFGISFQTPLVMLFLERIGLVDVKGFRSKRKYAYFGIALFAAMVMPTPDALNMSYLMVPMWGLYELGIWLCVFSPRRKKEDEFEVPESEELIEV